MAPAGIMLGLLAAAPSAWRWRHQAAAPSTTNPVESDERLLPLWGFVAFTIPLVLSPGPSTAVVLRNSVAGGVRAGLFTAAGANTGSFCYGLATAFGFAAALQRWPSVWTVMRWAGFVYLTWLGMRSLLRVRHDPGPRPVTRERAAPVQDSWRSFLSGYATNVLNPSLAAFYLFVVPQFVPASAPFTRSIITLTLMHIAMALTWHASWAIAGGTLSRVLSRRGARRALDIVTGLALLALAATLVANPPH